MRYLFVAALLLLCALLMACSDPARTARREVDRVSRGLLKADAGLKRTTREALLRIAEEEGTARGTALREAKCPSAAASQPASAPSVCHAIAKVAQERYSQRLAEVTGAAGKVDKSIGAVWASLLLVVDILEDIDSGWGNAKTLTSKLTVLVSDALRAYSDLLTAYQAYRAAWGAWSSAGGAR